jgi:succinate dehydrogenase/fumarate reductase flavoprotein subunit
MKALQYIHRRRSAIFQEDRVLKHVAEPGWQQATVPQISPSQIKETITAIQAGAKTVVLEKGETYFARGFDDGCVNSSVHKEAGVFIDRDEWIGELMRQANDRADQRWITMWVDHSGEAMDWLGATVAPKGVTASLGPVEAGKGVILSTGGYDNNAEMMKKYLRPSDLRIERYNSVSKICTGDGHNMGLAIGADMDEPPHALIVGNGIVNNKDEFYLVMFTPWLRVDKFGSRYVNEDSDYCRPPPQLSKSG